MLAAAGTSMRILTRLAGHENQICEDACFIDVFCACALHDRLNGGLYYCVSAHHGWHIRAIASIDEGTAKLTHDACWSSIMDVEVRARHVAQRLLRPSVHGFKWNVCVPFWMELRPRDCQPEFERHVEARRCGRCCAHLDTRKIVDRKAARLNQGEDSIEPRVSARYSQRDLRSETQLRQTYDVSEIELLKRTIIGDVQEDALAIQLGDSQLRGHASWRAILHGCRPSRALDVQASRSLFHDSFKVSAAFP